MTSNGVNFVWGVCVSGDKLAHNLHIPNIYRTIPRTWTKLFHSMIVDLLSSFIYLLEGTQKKDPIEI